MLCKRGLMIFMKYVKSLNRLLMFTYLQICKHKDGYDTHV